MNQDAWIEPDTLDELIRIHQRHPEYGLLSPMHLNAEKTGLVMKFFCQQPNNERLITDLYLQQLTDIYETRYIHAAAWLLPRDTLETVGGFDPIFQHYEEDDDYLNRVHFHGLKIGVCPSARIVHDHQNKQVNPFNTKSRYHREQRLLVKLLDLNTPFKVMKYYRFYLRKIISSLYVGEFHSAKGYFLDAVFINRNKKQILINREKNSQKGPNWIKE